MEQYGSSLPSTEKILWGTSDGQVFVQLNAVPLSPFTPPCKENKPTMNFQGIWTLTTLGNGK
jgi:hypothetical protein